MATKAQMEELDSKLEELAARAQELRALVYVTGNDYGFLGADVHTITQDVGNALDILEELFALEEMHYNEMTQRELRSFCIEHPLNVREIRMEAGSRSE